MPPERWTSKYTDENCRQEGLLSSEANLVYIAGLRSERKKREHSNYVNTPGKKTSDEVA